MGRSRYDSKHAGFNRKCTDCGKPTNDYRCKECWAKMKKADTSIQHSGDNASFSLNINSRKRGQQE